jgi:hypothetical protein
MTGHGHRFGHWKTRGSGWVRGEGVEWAQPQFKELSVAEGQG